MQLLNRWVSRTAVTGDRDAEPLRALLNSAFVNRPSSPAGFNYRYLWVKYPCSAQKLALGRRLCQVGRYAQNVILQLRGVMRTIHATVGERLRLMGQSRSQLPSDSGHTITNNEQIKRQRRLADESNLVTRQARP